MSSIFPVTVMSDLYRSEACCDLTGASLIVLCIFLTKRKMAKSGRTGKDSWAIVNNGSLVFSYREALTKYKISNCRFARAIDDLINHGFLRISKYGNPLAKEPNLYFLESMWKKFGQSDFKIEPRKNERRKIEKKGFCKPKIIL